jgi:hypothetical protein
MLQEVEYWQFDTENLPNEVDWVKAGAVTPIKN